MMIFKSRQKRPSRVMQSLFCLISYGLLTTAAAAEQVIDKIAAVVNNDVIMASELKATAQQVYAQEYIKQKGAISQQQVLRDVLEKMIMDKILVQRAKALGIKIDDAAVDTAMQGIAEQNKMDLPKLRRALLAQGMNYRDFRENLRDRIYINTLQKRQRRSGNRISENEVDDLIQAESFNLSKGVQYHLVDIVIPNKSGSVTAFNGNLNRARNLRRKLLLNRNLSNKNLASMGAKKIDLGWRDANSLSPIYSRTLSLMEPGELSQVIRDNQGLHILQLVEQRGGERQQITEARVRHILISNEEPQAKLKITQLRNKILAGENFAKLARRHSADKGSASNGGELPMSNLDAYVPPFKAAAEKLALNTLSQPVKTQFGWHIIEVLERRTSDNTREALKNQAKQAVGKKQGDDDLKNWMKRLRDEAFVEYRIKF